MFRWALYIPMSLIDSDTVTSNLVSRTEVREVRRLCVEGTRGYCVCAFGCFSSRYSCQTSNVRIMSFIVVRTEEKYYTDQFFVSDDHLSILLPQYGGSFERSTNFLIIEKIRVYFVYWWARYVLAICRFRGSSCLFYFKETWSRINARRKVNSGYDQVVRRYSWDDSRIRRSIWLTDFQEVRRRLNIFLIVIFISTRSSIRGSQYWYKVGC